MSRENRPLGVQNIVMIDSTGLRLEVSLRPKDIPFIGTPERSIFSGHVSCEMVKNGCKTDLLGLCYYQLWE